ncbi:MAG: hypothetical protein ACRDN9_14255 [Streptosporangiaceae bacterium]
MCSVNRVVDHLAPVDRATVAILAFVGSTGRPVACPVTPLVDGDDVVVSSVLALIRKVASIRRDPRVAVLAGGSQVRGLAQVELDEDGEFFHKIFRDQELRKYPPSRVLLRMPGHRRLFWWYAGRVLIRLSAPVGPTPGDDRATLTRFDLDGLPRVDPLPRLADADEATIDLGAAGLAGSVPEGRGCIVIHEEHNGGSDLRQLRLSGDIADGRFIVGRRTGSLLPARASPRDRVAGLRAMASQAKANQAMLAAWRQENTASTGPPAPDHN